jgi:hypothetical protein
MGFSYNVNVLNQKGSPAIYTDTFANRPTAGYVGRLFISTDTSAIYEDTGTSWTLIANVSSGAGTLEQVTTNGNTTTKGISISAGGLSTNSLTDTDLTLGSVLFAGAAGLVTQDNAAFFFDDTNNRLGINTTTPTNTLDLHYAGTGSTMGINNTAGNQSAIVFVNTGVNKWRIGNSATNTFDIYNSALASIAFQLSNADNRVDIDGNVFLQKSLALKTGSSNVSAAGYTLIHSVSGTGLEGIQLSLSTGGFASLVFNSTNNRQFTFPNADGTVALTSNLSAYLPLAGGTMTGTLEVTNVSNGINLIGKTGNPIYLSTDQSTNNSGKIWRVGNTGATSNYTSFDIYNQTDSITAISIPSNGNVLIGSITDNTVNKLQVTGSGKFTSSLTSVGINSTGQITCTASVADTGAINGLLNLSNTSSGCVVNTILPNSSTSGSIFYRAQTVRAGANDQYFFIGQTGNGSSIITNNVIITTNGGALFAALSGTGSRAVLADSSGNLSAPVSDQSVKENIEPLKYGLETILQLNAVQFEFIEGYKNYGEGLQIGTIAQEVEQIIPEAVFTTPSTGLKGINYDQLNGIYIKAIQDQQKIIESLIKRIELLENK